MTGLSGVRVALLEGRMSRELAELVRRRGGDPWPVPAVRDAPVDAGAAVARFLDRLAARAAPVIVLSTGAGVSALFAAARALGRAPELRALLRRATLACRGPKPIAALHREGITPGVSAGAPFTTRDLLDALAPLDLDGRGVGIVHYGERNGGLVDAVRARGAEVEELALYAWRLPEDLGPLRALVAAIVAGRVGAVAFTSQAQAHHLFQVAEGLVPPGALAEALRTRTVVAAVGPTCARALEALGARPHVVPEHPKMGAMVAALAQHLSRSSEDATP